MNVRAKTHVRNSLQCTYESKRDYMYTVRVNLTLNILLRRTVRLKSHRATVSVGSFVVSFK
uniref:Uncharacterized protein n=1 Tax=Anguilla anguilla TaxID=7936 RepID=A0A0E9UJ36_ANGAN